MIVRYLLPADDEAYEALLCLDPGNLIYASKPFLDFLAEATGARISVLVAERESAIVGALPYAVLDAPGIGRIVNSLPWWGSHGSIILDRDDHEGVVIRRALLARLVDELQALMPLSATIILLPAEEPFRSIYEEVLNPTASDARIGQMTDLPPDGPDLERRLLSSFKQKTRNLVRKGEKQGFLETITDDDWAWDFLWQTHAANITALGGRAKPRSHFAALRARIPRCNRRLSIAMDGATPVAAMLTLFFNRTVEYVTPAIDVMHRSRQPLSFLIFRGMVAAIHRGYTVWNWGGTWQEQHALHHFKAGFGASEHPYSYLIRASVPAVRTFREYRQKLSTLFPYFYIYPYTALGNGGAAGPARGEHVL